MEQVSTAGLLCKNLLSLSPSLPLPPPQTAVCSVSLAPLTGVTLKGGGSVWMVGLENHVTCVNYPQAVVSV